jgi:hypothetical protein
MHQPRVFADFHNADAQGRLRLNCIGTVEDLAQHQIVLREDLPLILYSEELEVEGVAQYSTDEHIWVAVIEWNAIRDAGTQALLPDTQASQQRYIASQGTPPRG